MSGSTSTRNSSTINGSSGFVLYIILDHVLGHERLTFTRAHTHMRTNSDHRPARVMEKYISIRGGSHVPICVYYNNNNVVYVYTKRVITRISVHVYLSTIYYNIILFYFVTHITCVVLDYEKYDSAMEDLRSGSCGGIFFW